MHELSSEGEDDIVRTDIKINRKLIRADARALNSKKYTPLESKSYVSLPQK